MNGAQLHLLLNHIPVLLIPTSLVIISLAKVYKEPTWHKLALGMLVFGSLVCIPVYLSGEGAEETVENKPGVSENQIEEHEEAANIALILTILSGASAAGSLTLKNEKYKNLANKSTVVIAALAFASLAFAAHQGGLIRHPEVALSAHSQEGHSNSDNDDD